MSEKVEFQGYAHRYCSHVQGFANGSNSRVATQGDIQAFRNRPGVFESITLVMEKEWERLRLRWWPQLIGKRSL